MRFHHEDSLRVLVSSEEVHLMFEKLKTTEFTQFPDPFIGVHLFETSAFLLDSIKLHYTEVSVTKCPYKSGIELKNE